MWMETQGGDNHPLYKESSLRSKERCRHLGLGPPTFKMVRKWISVSVPRPAELCSSSTSTLIGLMSLISCFKMCMLCSHCKGSGWWKWQPTADREPTGWSLAVFQRPGSGP